MTNDDELDPVARLRAADPAAEITPRTGFAAEVVSRVTGRTAEPAPAEPAPADPAPVADLAGERARRRRWVPIAAVAASVAIVGALGYGLGATTGPTTNLAEGSAAPPISLQTGRDGSLSAPAEAGAADGSVQAPGGAGSADAKMSSSYPWGFGRNHFTATGLGAGAGSGTAYAFDPRAASSAEKVAALAAAFGITSPVELKDGAWMAGAQDGSGPYLSVSLDGMLSFYYQDPRINPWNCDGGTEACQPTGQAPSEDAAIGALRSHLVAAGRNPDTFEFSSYVWEGSPTRTAEARPVVDGQRIDQPWSIELAEGGVVNANGALADLVALGTYPVVSEQEGFERLSDPRFGAGTTILPAATRELAATEESTPEQWVPPTEPPATPTGGSSVSWPVNDVSIVSVRLGLASQWQPDGSVLVVPAYEFTDSDGATWSVIAVDESKLDFRSE